EYKNNDGPNTAVQKLPSPAPGKCHTAIVAQKKNPAICMQMAGFSSLWHGGEDFFDRLDHTRELLTQRVEPHPRCIKKGCAKVEHAPWLFSPAHSARHLLPHIVFVQEQQRSNGRFVAVVRELELFNKLLERVRHESVGARMSPHHKSCD